MRCKDCWDRAQLNSHNYESTTEAYYAEMARAEAEGRPCTKPETRELTTDVGE
jgi:hypothetical protein